ncbi:hypothetical protein [Streptomyces sp. AHA2]|uniref:hypothetical protein n=1 Tax=Streptomyces sp. AHA2 TaxID=3064526 RepID=UPI002FE2F60A
MRDALTFTGAVGGRPAADGTTGTDRRHDVGDGNSVRERVREVSALLKTGGSALLNGNVPALLHGDVSALLKSARAGRVFLESSRRDGGTFDFAPWPQVRPRRFGPVGRAATAVSGLRAVQRMSVGFLDPVEDAICLTVGLRHMGFAASFHLGREIVPAAPPAGFYAWVRCGGAVLSTSLPVKEEYVEIYTDAPEGEHSA